MSSVVSNHPLSSAPSRRLGETVIPPVRYPYSPPFLSSEQMSQLTLAEAVPRPPPSQGPLKTGS
jgi:hypothetical protein